MPTPPWPDSTAVWMRSGGPAASARPSSAPIARCWNASARGGTQAVRKGSGWCVVEWPPWTTSP
ncbi:hypothetical protein AB0A74_22340 [Saccharothrix sp. NPDC042600]|uniref:hypothetical protein n=1 Tax=Saccharothrix TaxID=2071 RepID=UPI0033CAFC4E